MRGTWDAQGGIEGGWNELGKQWVKEGVEGETSVPMMFPSA